MTTNLNLTKSKFKLAFECSTKLYYLDKPQFANHQLEDTFLKALADGSYQIEELALCYLPEGVFVQSNSKESCIEVTKRLKHG
ncbi:hypothetical protein ACM9VS_04740 [Legionella pneumophila]|uniref:hypothetical protein n=1 Tax=Legionella pneumophila TaxID=446 RepID=UPI003A4C57BD